MQESYAESITYHSSVSGHSLNQQNIRRLATAAAADVPVLQAGNIVCVMPDEEYLENNGAAFWLAKVIEETEKPTQLCRFCNLLHVGLTRCVWAADEFGRRINPALDNDEINIAWMGAANNKGCMNPKKVEVYGNLPARTFVDVRWKNTCSLKCAPPH
eukprot:6174517-Pleurochrysis_carterae.AAC.1